MGKNRVKSYDELSEIEKEDLARFGGGRGVANYDKQDPKQIISNEFNAPYNATEDIPEQFRGGTIDQSYDRYAEDSPVHGNWLRLKRILGKGLYGGNEK